MRTWLGQLCAAAAVAVAAVLGAVPALPQTFAPTTPVVVDAEYEALFQAVLRDPANLDLTFRFAEAATRRGDVEAAIGALERIIFYNPRLSRVRLELGLLYFRLGSYEMARSYFNSALEGSDPPPEVQARVAAFLAEIDRRTNVQAFSLYAQAGVRYQTNANAGPSSTIVRAFGQDAVLGRQFLRRSDWNVFGLAAARHVYDFENQRGDVWETNAAAYASRQFTFGRLNLSLAELQTGPRLALAPDFLPGWSVRPYGLVNGVSLADSNYLSTVGGGITLTAPLAPWLIVEPFFEFRNRRFENSVTYPIASEQSGQLFASGLFFQGALASLGFADVRWQARGAYLRNDVRSRFDYNSYDQVAVDFGLPIEFDGFWGPRRWAFVPTVGYAHYAYDTPNAVVDPLVTRRDSEVRVGAILDIPLWAYGGFGIQVQYSEITSRIRNYDTHNVAVSFGPTLRF